MRQHGEPDDKAFDLMPPPMPRTPSGKGGNGGSLRSTPVLPLRKHDPNNRGRGDAVASGGDVGVGPGRLENRASYVKVRIKEGYEGGGRLIFRSCGPVFECLYYLEML